MIAMAFWDSIKNAVGGFVDSASEHINNGLNSLKDIGKDVVDAVDGAIDWVTDKVSGALSDREITVVRPGGTIQDSIFGKDQIGGVPIINPSNPPFNLSGGSGSGSVIDKVKDTIDNTVDNIKDKLDHFVDDPVGAITGALNGVINDLKGAVAGIPDAITGALNSAISGLSSAFNGAMEWIKNGLDGVTQSISNAFNSITSTISDWITSAAQTLSNVLSPLWDVALGIMSIAKLVTNPQPEEVARIYTQLFEGVQQGAAGAVERL